MASDVYMIDTGGKGQWGTHKCSVLGCEWQYPPQETINWELDQTKHHVGEEFERHANHDHGNPKFRKPEAGQLVKAPGHVVGAVRVFNVGRETVSLRLPPAEPILDVPWAHLSYPNGT